MWLTDQLHGSQALSAPMVCARIRGPLDPIAISGALTAIHHRHEALRTTFDVVDGEPTQTVSFDLEPDHDVIQMPHADPAQCAETCAEEIRRGFDLSTGPPVRSRLYQMAADDHLLLAARHHIISDGRSSQLFVNELQSHYRALINGEAAQLPALDVQYPDVARWQRERMSPERVDHLVAECAPRVQRLGERAALPLDRPRPLRRQSLGRSFTKEIPPALAEATARCARAEAASVFMVLLTAFRLALWQHTSERDVLVATPVEDRAHPQTQHLIGCFLNTVLLPGNLGENPTVRELIARERAATLDALAGQELPYPLLSRALGKQSPPIRVTFAYHYGEQPVPQLPGLTVTPIDLGRVVSIFDLMVKVSHDERGMRLQVAYDDEILDETTVRQLAERFLTMMRQAVADPGAPAARLVGHVASSPTISAPTADETRRPEPAVLLWTSGEEAGGPPTGPIQELIAGMWADLLDTEPPGVEVSILDCGGHSLLLAKLVFRLRETCYVDVSVADLYEHQTIASQAVLVEAALTTRLHALSADQVAQLLTGPD